MKRVRILALLLALCLAAAACASGEESVSGSTVGEEITAGETIDDMADEEMSDEEMSDEEMSDDGGAEDDMADDDTAMDDMAMADPDATPADQVEGADLQSGSFVLLDTAPDGYDNATGTAFLARTDDGATATLYVEGLPADVDFISHIHEQSCDTDNGGPHFKFDPDGADVPPNEIHLSFTSDADGNGTVTVTSDMVPGDDAKALVIHPTEFPDNRALCADFS